MRSKPERYQRITGKGVSPAVLASTQGPIAIGPDGDVYPRHRTNPARSPSCA